MREREAREKQVGSKIDRQIFMKKGLIIKRERGFSIVLAW